MAKATKTIGECPNCGSKHVNKIDWSDYYCMDCCVEIDRKGNIYTIQYDGERVGYYVNEFADIN